MPPKHNPLNLNPLQLKTLTLLQELARVAGAPATEQDEPGGVAITQLPNPHGDHFHLGEAVVAARDATGLRNPSVWAALERKGLIRPKLPEAVILTTIGQEYDTGMHETILHRANH
jgi:LmbE family N-acetylglucosaminyl deacetylase